MTEPDAGIPPGLHRRTVGRCKQVHSGHHDLLDRGPASWLCTSKCSLLLSAHSGIELFSAVAVQWARFHHRDLYGHDRL